MGRRSTFNPAVGAKLLDLILSDDVPIKHAAKQAGIGVRTLYDLWFAHPHRRYWKSAHDLFVQVRW
jgi:hypothetical protein